MTTDRPPKVRVTGRGGPRPVPSSDPGSAERAVLSTAAIGLGIGVVAPTVWAGYPWMTSELWVWAVLFGPPAVALAGAVRAHRRLPGSWLAPVVVLDGVIAVVGWWAVLWGSGPGAVSGACLVVAALVLWDERPRRWAIAGCGLLAMVLSLVGTMGFVTYVFPEGWWAPAMSGLNLVALAVLARRAVVAGRSADRCASGT